jgi:radical SAM protein with 4Fe4S-binding SPASM domain
VRDPKSHDPATAKPYARGRPPDPPDDPARAPVRQVGTLLFEVTRRCDHDCLHCYNAWRNALPYPPSPWPGGELDTADTLAMLDKVLRECGTRDVTLTGGEPLLREDLPELVAFLHDRGCRITLISNGSRLDAAALARLPAAHIDVFELPLLSAEAGIHDRLSGRAGAFDRVTEAVADLKLADATVVTVFVATKLNLATFEETAALALALGADGLMFNRFNPGGHGGRNLTQLQPSVEALRAALDTAERFCVDHALPVACSIAMPPCLFDHARWPHLSFGYCAAGTADSYYALDPAGNLRPCNHSMVVLGNVRERPFWELTDSETLRDFVAARPRFCEGCAEVERCLGGCKAAAEVCTGDLWACDPFLAANLQLVEKP